MADATFNPDWSPTTQPVARTDFEGSPVLVLHYWAVWDLHDREMDKRLDGLREDYADRICFRSCDVDRVENQRFIQGIANIPALGCFIGGKWFESLIGLRSAEELRCVFDGWLDVAATPANHTLQRTGAAGKLSFVRRFLGRGPVR